jgi:long-chain fatty acid transport protein
VEIFDGLYFGAGLTYIASTKGVLDVVGTVSASDADRTRLFSAVDVTFSSVRYPTLALLYAPLPELRFGLTYRHEFVLGLDLGVHVRGNITIGDEELIAVENGSFMLDSFNTDLFSPRQLVLGGSYVWDEFTFSVDIAWLDWSRFPPPVSAIDLTVDLGALDVDVPVPDKPLPAQFHDIFIPRFGVEWAVLELVSLRAGYAFEPSPAPAQTGLTNYIDSAKHQLSFGVGLRLPIFEEVFPKQPVLDFGVSGIFLTQRIYEKSDPADAVGDYPAGGRIFSAAATLAVEFP